HVDVAGTVPSLTPVVSKVPAGLNMAVNQLPPELQSGIQRIKKGLGSNFASVTYHTRKGWQEEGFGLYEIGFNAQGRRFSLPVPFSTNGMLVEGSTQSSKRIAPDVAIFDPKSKSITGRMKRHEFFLSNFEQSVLPD